MPEDNKPHPASPSSSLIANLRLEMMRALPFSRMQPAHVDRFITGARQAYFAPDEVLLDPTMGPVNALHLIRRSPYVTFCLAYCFGYIVVFSGFSNFGILVRERSLALPAFVVLLALPVAARYRREPKHSRPRVEALR